MISPFGGTGRSEGQKNQSVRGLAGWRATRVGEFASWRKGLAELYLFGSGDVLLCLGLAIAGHLPCAEALELTNASCLGKRPAMRDGPFLC